MSKTKTVIASVLAPLALAGTLIGTAGPANAANGWDAADYASTMLGEVYADPNDAAQYAASDWAPGEVGEWSGDCVKLPHLAWTYATGNRNTVVSGNAIDQYHYYRDAGKIQQGEPPRNALVFYNVTSLGHVALGMGGGNIATTRGLDGDHLSTVLTNYNHFSNYLGCATVYTGDAQPR